IRARLDALPREQRTVIQGGAVVGRTFQRSAVATLVDGPVEEHLEQAILRDIVTEEPSAEPSYRFKHILIRDVAYATLPKARRAELHRRVVDWLREWAGDRIEEFIEIEAYHLEQAVSLARELEGRVDPELLDEAAAALERSARKAAARSDLRAQVNFAERGLALEPPLVERQLELQMLLVEGLSTTGDLRRARELGEALAEVAAQAGRPDLRGRALLAVAFDVWLGLGHAEGRVAGMELLQEARRELERAGDDEHLADVLFNLAWDGWWLGDVARARRAWEEAAELAHRIGDPAREARALLRISQTLENEGRPDEAMETLARAQVLAEGTSRWSQAGVNRRLGVMLYNSGSDPIRGKALLEQALALAQETGSLDEEEYSLQNLAEVSLVEGDLTTAISRFEEQVAILAEVGHAGRLPEADRLLAAALVEAGDVDRAEFHAQRALDTVEPDDWFTVGTTRISMGLVRDAQGREAEAADLIREGRETLERTTFKAELGEIYLVEAEFHLRHGREEEGERLLAVARDTLTATVGPDSPLLSHANRRAAAARRLGGAAQQGGPASR
ncbi:MAG: hypothetical protein ACRDE9_01700, partial [Candidatus Limnocylindria bacterium]